MLESHAQGLPADNQAFIPDAFTRDAAERPRISRRDETARLTCAKRRYRSQRLAGAENRSKREARLTRQRHEQTRRNNVLRAASGLDPPHPILTRRIPSHRVSPPSKRLAKTRLKAKRRERIVQAPGRPSLPAGGGHPQESFRAGDRRASPLDRNNRILKGAFRASANNGPQEAATTADNQGRGGRPNKKRVRA
jgi:hypothetical protein